jgi:hypothetical protein
LSTQVSKAGSNCSVTTVREEGKNEENGGSDIGSSNDASHGFSMDWMSRKKTTRDGCS